MTRHRVLAVTHLAAVALFVLPLALILLTSLAQGDVVGFPIRGVGLHWYKAALSDPAYRRAFALSAGLAMASATLAVIVGSWIGLAAAGLRSRGGNCR